MPLSARLAAKGANCHFAPANRHSAVDTGKRPFDQEVCLSGVCRDQVDGNYQLPLHYKVWDPDFLTKICV